MLSTEDSEPSNYLYQQNVCSSACYLLNSSLFICMLSTEDSKLVFVMLSIMKVTNYQFIFTRCFLLKKANYIIQSSVFIVMLSTEDIKRKQFNNVKITRQNKQRIFINPTVPDFAKTRSWRSLEVNGEIFIWYHAEGNEPTWFPPVVEGIKTGQMKYHGYTEHYINAHIEVNIKTSYLTIPPIF